MSNEVEAAHPCLDPTCPGVECGPGGAAEADGVKKPVHALNLFGDGPYGVSLFVINEDGTDFPLLENVSAEDDPVTVLKTVTERLAEVMGVEVIES